MNILIADSDLETRKTFANQLIHEGHTIVGEASTATEALEIAKDVPSDYLCVNLNGMHKRDRELAERMKLEKVNKELQRMFAEQKPDLDDIF